MKYNDLIIEHFNSPLNVGRLEKPTVAGHAVNAACLDKMGLELEISDGVITKAMFQVEGCVPCIACGSILTEWLRGMPLHDAESLTAKELEARAGGLPSGKKHAAALAIEALQDALAKI